MSSKGRTIYVNSSSMKCSFPNCTNIDEETTLYPFPRDQALIRIWKTVCRFDADKQVDCLCICDKHFSPASFTTDNYLVPNAVPVPLPETHKSSALTVILDHDYLRPSNDEPEDETIINNNMEIETEHAKVPDNAAPPSENGILNHLNDTLSNKENTNFDQDGLPCEERVKLIENHLDTYLKSKDEKLAQFYANLSKTFRPAYIHTDYCPEPPVKPSTSSLPTPTVTVTNSNKTWEHLSYRKLKQERSKAGSDLPPAPSTQPQSTPSPIKSVYIDLAKQIESQVKAKINEQVSPTTLPTPAINYSTTIVINSQVSGPAPSVTTPIMPRTRHNLNREINMSVHNLNYHVKRSALHKSLKNNYGTAKRTILRTKKALEQKKLELRKIRQNIIDRNFFAIDDMNCVKRRFIECQLQNREKDSRGNRFNEADKQFAAGLYKTGLRNYNFLCRYFCLPGRKAINRVLDKFEFKPGTNEAILKALESEVSRMSTLERYCSLSFSMMPLTVSMVFNPESADLQMLIDEQILGEDRSFANNALVFMVRGCFKSWTQVVAYYFVNDDFSSADLIPVVTENITKLQNIGLNVTAIVCEQTERNVNVFQQMHVQQKYLLTVNDQSIAIVYDAPHLIKNTRDTLLKYSVLFNDNMVAKFEYVESVFHLDQNRAVNLLSKLQARDFNYKAPRSTLNNTRVGNKIAAAQLSHTVAGAMEVYTHFEALPVEAMETAHFINIIDTLFDSLNTYESNFFKSRKKYRVAVNEKSLHMDFWKDILAIMPDWRLFDLNTGQEYSTEYTFIKGWQTSVRSLVFLWTRLNGVGFKSLCTSNFNLDPIEHLFSSIKIHLSQNDSPTCVQFVKALKYCMNKPNSRDNFEDDKNSFIDNNNICSFVDIIHNQVNNVANAAETVAVAPATAMLQ